MTRLVRACTMPLARALVVALCLVPLPLRAQDAAQDASSDDVVDSRPELVLWHAYRAAEQAAIEQIVVGLNAREARFRVKVLAVPYDAYLDKITAAIPRGRGPDVFIAAHDGIGDWAEAGTIAAVDDVLDPNLLSTLHDGLVPAVLYGGKAYGVPLAFKSLALWRRTDVVPNAPATLAELEAAATANTGDGRYGLVYENRLLYFHAPFLHGFGGAVLDDRGAPTLASAQGVESVRYAMRLGRELGVVPQEVNGALAVSLFSDGKAALMINGPWARGELPDGVPFAVSPLPKTNAGQPLLPFLSVEAAFISGKAKDRALAVELVRSLADEDASKVRLVTGQQPVARKSAWTALDAPDADAKLGAFLRGFRDQLPHTVPTPNTPAMKSLWSPYDLALGASLGQGLDPQQTLQEAQEKVQGIVKGIEARGQASEGGAGFAVFVVVIVSLVLGLLVLLLVRYGPRRFVRDVARSKTAYLYAAPAMIAMAVLVFVPFLFGTGMGFFEHAWGTYRFVGLGNYASILAGSDSKFFRTLLVTIVWTATNVFLHTTIGVLLALVLSQAQLRFRGLYRVLFIIPWAVPSYITALIWKGMFHPELGAINRVLGIEGFSWMNATWSAFIANLVTNTWLGFPFMMVIALGGLTAIPKDLYEAAALDGATTLQRFFRITLPLLQPTLLPAVILGTVWTFNMFNVIYLVSGGAPGGGTDILITEAYRWAFERGQGGAFGYAAAYSTLIFLMLLGYNVAAARVTAQVRESRG